MRRNTRAIQEARQAVLTAPDRESLLVAYRWYYALVNGLLDEPKEEKPMEQEIPMGPGWLADLERVFAE